MQKERKTKNSKHTNQQTNPKPEKEKKTFNTDNIYNERKTNRPAAKVNNNEQTKLKSITSRRKQIKLNTKVSN